MKYSLIFKEAERLHKLGLAIHWLHARSKRPVESGWTSGPRKPWAYLAETYTTSLNVGVRTGTPSKTKNGYLAVIDVDVKSTDPRHKAEALAAVKRLIEGLELPMVTSGRGNGSRHYYCLTPKPFKTFNPAESDEIVKVKMPSKRPSKAELKALSEDEIEKGIRLANAWEISLYSDGRQVVLPPSVHPDSGELYRWEKPLTALSDLTVIEWPTAGPTLPGIEVSTGPARDAWEEELLGEEGGPVREAHPAAERSEEAAHEFRVEPVELSWLPISDAVKLAITEGKGVEDRSGYLLKASTALISAGLSTNEVLTVLTDPKTFLGAVGYEHAQTKDRARAAAWIYRYTFKKVAAERRAENVFGKASEMPKPIKLTPEEMEEVAAEFEAERTWRSRLDRTDKGKTKVTLKNLDLIFTNSVEDVPFVEDLFASRIEYGSDTPWGGKAGEYIKDIDMIKVKRWLADTEFGIEPSKDAVLEATTLVADREKYHPVRDWLESLKWDGVPRIDTWVKDYCEGEAEEPFLSEASRKFLLAMVKRIFEPGCQWDYVLVLEGTQGKYKSSIARAIAGDKWFMDNLPDLKDKDSMLNLQGKWLIELGELASVKRTDFNQVKAYLVRRTDTVRPHYGRLVGDVPRQSVFIGTVNEGQYLKDPTGNRRYWPIKVGLCDVQGLKRVRDQLFAEAVHVYKTTNEVLMLGPEATIQATEAQEERRIDDDETEMREALVEFLESPKGKELESRGFRVKELTIGEGAPFGKWATDKYFKQNAGQVLRNVGFMRRKIHGQRIWRRPENRFIKQGAYPQNQLCPAMPPMPPDFGGSDDFDFR